jgi:hypothetical protein
MWKKVYIQFFLWSITRDALAVNVAVTDVNTVCIYSNVIHLYLSRRGDLSWRTAASFSFSEGTFYEWKQKVTQTSFSSMNSPSLSAGLKRNEASRCTLCVALWMDRIWRGVWSVSRTRALVLARLLLSAMYTTIHNAAHGLWSWRYERMAFVEWLRWLLWPVSDVRTYRMIEHDDLLLDTTPQRSIVTSSIKKYTYYGTEMSSHMMWHNKPTISFNLRA